MACSADRHGNESAYRQGCRCPEARDDRRTRQKLRDAGLARPAYTDPTGTARRLQALSALGWAAPDLASRLAAPEATVMQARRGMWQQVRADFAAKVARVYEELQGTPGGNERTRAWAEKVGYAPPLAWEDDAIDDRAATPLPVAGRPSAGLHLDDVKFLESCRESRDDIARRMNVAPESIERAEYRAQERARAAVERARAAVQAATEPAAFEAAPTSSRELEHAR